MRKFARTLAVLLTVLSISSIAGVRGPGKYYGVVLFDRWDTCYIYSGVYLMYVSKRVNESLRQYEGRAMVIDALSVDQPMNPGDGRIDRFRLIGAATSNRSQVRLEGLSLRVSPRFTFGLPKFILEMRNKGTKKVELGRWELAPTLLGRSRL